MKVEKIEVENYRLLKDFSLDIRDELSLIVGKNNTGKTSVLTILDRILDGTNLSLNFSWNDFNIDFQKHFYDSVTNYKSEVEDDPFKPEGIKMTMMISYDKKDSYANIQKFMMDLNPDNNIIILEFLYVCLENKLKILKEELDSSSISNFSDFSNMMLKNSNKYFKFLIYSRKWDKDKEEKSDEFSDKISLSEVRELISFKSIKANRDASNKENDHSLSNLSYKYYDLIGNTDNQIIEKLESAVSNADGELDEVYKNIFQDVIETVQKFGGRPNDSSITIKSSINEIDLLRNNTSLLYNFEGHHLPENYNGLGYLNLIGMIFEIETILESFRGNEERKQSDINLIFIEEPEAHTHPQLQYIFIKNIKDLINSKVKKESNLNIQTILTTHSSHILSSTDDFNDIRYLKLESNSTFAKNMESLEELYTKQEITVKDNSTIEVYKFIKQYLTLNSSELFFADKAIVVEGDTERILLPSMLKKFDKVNNDTELLPLSSQNITVLTVGAHAYLFKPLFDFLGIKVLIITDIDGVKKNENGNREKCKSSEAVYTSNNTLIKLLELKNTEEHFKVLASYTSEQKEIDDIKIAYQIKKDNYIPRSFEDAFIQENYDYIYENKENFVEGLKKRSELDKNPEEVQDQYPEKYYDLAENCIAKKSAFATEILLNDNIKDKEWAVPTYIKEGLEWLIKQ